jgi:hypothetical protein
VVHEDATTAIPPSDAKHFARNNELLNLARAVKNAKGARMTEQPFDRRPFPYAEAAEHLHGLVDDFGRGLACIEFGDRSFTGDTPV